MGRLIDLTGQKIGKLKILERKRENNRTYYYCKCDCNNKLWIRADSLTKKNPTQSCGCASEETQFKPKDISNKRFGRLVTLKPTEKRTEYNGSIIWECRCKCGNICYISECDLTRNGVKSCGCLGKENSKNNMQKAIYKHLREHIVEGTNIPVISRKEVNATNTSGVTGVTWDKSRNMWIAQIQFKKEHYFLGRRKNKEDAIKLRKEAEEKLFDKFLEWYKEKYKK